MLSKTTLLSFALVASVTAQSTITKTLLLDGYDKDNAPSVTAIGSNADATTYTISCTDPIQTSALQSALSNAGNLFSSLGGDLNSLASQGRDIFASLTARDAQPTAAPGHPRRFLQRRQNDHDDFLKDLNICLPYTLIQGPSTYVAQYRVSEMSLSVDFNCNFGSGKIFEADATCTVSGAGNLLGVTVSETGEVMTTKVSDYTELAQTVAVTLGSGVSGTGSAAGAQNTGAAGRVGVDSGVFGLAGAAGAAFLGAALAL